VLGHLCIVLFYAFVALFSVCSAFKMMKFFNTVVVYITSIVRSKNIFINFIVLCWIRYTDRLQDINPYQVYIHRYNFCYSGLSFCCLILICFEQAEEMFDVASRYLLFPLKRAVADVLLPHLEMVSLDEHCHWLMLADMYLPFCQYPSILQYCIQV